MNPDEMDNVIPETPTDDGGEQPTDGGEQPTDDGGEQPTDDGGEQPTDGGGEQPTDGGEQPTDDGGEQPTDDGGEQPTDDGGEQPTDDGGEQPTDDGGEQPTDGGGEQPTDDGGEQPTDDGGEQPTDGGGEQPTDDGGEQPTDDGEQPTDDGGDGITASISVDVESIPEGNDGETTIVTYTVSTSAPLDRDARVIVESTGGNNPLLSEPLDIPAGQQSVTFTNEVSGDSVPEENETLTGTLAFAAFNAPDGSTGDEIPISQSTANVTVIDDDGEGETFSEISIADATLVEGNEGNSSLEFTVSLSQPINEVATTDYSTSGFGDGTAIAGEDFIETSGSLTFQPGETSQTFSVEIIGDTVEEEDETFSVGVRNSLGVAIGDSDATGTIIDDDGEDEGEETSNITADLSVDVTSIPEGNDGETSVITYTVTLSEPVPDQSVRGIIDTSVFDGFVFDDGADEGLDIAPGETTGTFTYTFSGDNLEEPDETIDVSLGFVGLMDDGSGNGRNETFNLGQSSVSTTILDDDGNNANRPILSITSDLGDSIPEGNEGDTNSLDYTISLDNPVERDITVGLEFNRTGNGQNVSFGDSVTISAGQQSVSYNAGDISGDNVEEEDESTTISLQNASYADGGDGDIIISDAQSSATITVLDDDGENAGDGSNIVYRFFNPSAGVHFYTDDEVERDFVQDELDNYDFEGASYRTVDSLSGQAEDVYRFFNSNTGVHLYTTDENERDSIIDNLDDFTFEGSAYSAYETQIEGSIPIYRFFEPSIGVHFYTPNEAERDVVDTELDNYNNEGIAFYALPLDAGDL